MNINKMVDPFQYLFWRTQISVLRKRPPLQGAVTKISMGAANSRKRWFKMLFQVATKLPRAFFLHLRDKLKKCLVLGRVTILVTLRCTLNCDKCAVRVPDLRKNRMDVPAHDLVQDIRALLSRVDFIYAVVITGGEAFLHPGIGEVVQALVDSGKVGCISVETNGTIIPNDEVLAALKEAKAAIQISKYAHALQPRVETLKDVLKENGLSYTHESGTFWHDKAPLNQLQGGCAEKRFRVCTQPLCLYYRTGKLHLCAESVFLLEAGLAPDRKEDYIDIYAANPGTFRAELQKLLKKRSLSICTRCIGRTYKTPKIPVAVQREA